MYFELGLCATYNPTWKRWNSDICCFSSQNLLCVSKVTVLQVQQDVIYFRAVYITYSAVVFLAQDSQ